MYPRNNASPEKIPIGPVVQISDGVVQTSGVTVRIIPTGVAEGDGAGTTAYSTDGVVLYTPTQAETNYASFILIAKKAGCIPASQMIVPTESAIAGRVSLGAILGTALTETSGYLAAGFKKFFNVATPTSTMNQITLVDTVTTNTDMRGTDGAYTGTPPTVAEITTDMDANSTKLSGIQSDTNDLQTQIGTAGAGLTGIPKTGYKLASDGLDTVATTSPSGVASNFREMVVATWRYLYKKTTLTATQLKAYDDAGTTAIATMTVSDDGSTQTKGEAS